MRRTSILTVNDCIHFIVMVVAIVILLMISIPSIFGADTDSGLNKTEAIIKTTNNEVITVEVDRWYSVNDDSQIKIFTTDGEVYCVSPNNVTIVMRHGNEEG